MLTSHFGSRSEGSSAVDLFALWDFFFGLKALSKLEYGDDQSGFTKALASVIISGLFIGLLIIVLVIELAKH